MLEMLLRDDEEPIHNISFLAIQDKVDTTRLSDMLVKFSSKKLSQKTVLLRLKENRIFLV